MAALTIIEHAHTNIGTIYLGMRQIEGREGWVHEIMIDAELLMSDISPQSEMKLASSALSKHISDEPLQILVGGLGLGYTAKAALEDSRVKKVRVVEKMEFVIDWMHRGLLPLSTTLSGNKRVEIAQGDIYDDLLAAATDTYDLILVDVDHAPDFPLSSTSDPFYTVEGQQRVAKHLKTGGMLGVWSAFDNDAFANVLDKAYSESHREYVSWPNEENPDTPFQNVLFFAS